MDEQQTGGFADADLAQDGWTDIAIRVRDRIVAEMHAGASFNPATIQKAFEDSDDEKMTGIRARVDAIVKDRATAEVLKPWYRQLCKRPCFHDEYACRPTAGRTSTSSTPTARAPSASTRRASGSAGGTTRSTA